MCLFVSIAEKQRFSLKSLLCSTCLFSILALKKAVFPTKLGPFYPSSHRISTPRTDNTWQAFLQEVQDVTCTIGAVKIVAQGGCE